MAYKGRYNPIHPKKYKGDHHNIIYRSLWERKFMVYCDTSDNIIEWGSEEIIIPYLSPWDGRMHRYFPDFYIKVRQHNGSIKKFIIEIKPKKQCSPPEKLQNVRLRSGLKKSKHGVSTPQSGSMRLIGVRTMVWNSRY